jgi:CheY-like chemotaxis protein
MGAGERGLARVLIVAREQGRRDALMTLVGEGDAAVTAVGTGEDALDALRRMRFDCAVLDTDLPDMSGAELCRRICSQTSSTVRPIIHAGPGIPAEEQAALQDLGASFVDGPVLSGSGRQDALSMRVLGAVQEGGRMISIQFGVRRSGGSAMKVLIIDDDVRNVYSMTSALERHGMDVTYADGGMEGIRKLRENPDTDIILVDIMMPEMDGYETIRAIRAIDRFRSVPIVAVTAKALQGDREKCLEAGANDYFAKPVQIEHLVSALRAWVTARQGEPALEGAAE